MTSVSHSGRPSAGRACLRCFRHKRTLWGTASRTSLLNSDCKLTLTFEICFYSLCELPYRHSSNYLWLDRTFVDFKTILNLICHLDALFTEELCTPGLWASGESVAAVEGGKKRDSVDKATGAHYLVVYAGPRRTIDGCQRRVWSRQMGLHPTFHTKDD